MTARRGLAALWALAAVLAAGPATAATQTLAFESACFDLDTGAAGDCRAPGARWDVLMGFHADGTTHAFLVHDARSGVEVARITGKTYAEVTSADIAGAPFGSELLDEPLDASAVVLVRTDEGAVFKLGHASETDDHVSFDHDLLEDAP